MEVWRVFAVPEAQTWLMLLSGLGILGFAARRQAGNPAYCSR